MILAFTLSMPNRGSWDGRWSGEDKNFVKVVNMGRGKARTEKAEAIVNKGYFHYSWSDGWAAGISVKQVDAAKGRALRRKSDGFCGYDWMVTSIIAHGEIRDD